MKRYLLVIDPAAACWRRLTGLFLFFKQYPRIKPAPVSRPYPGSLQIVKIVVIYLLVINAGSVQAQQSVAAEDTAYLKVVNERAAKIVTTLGINNESAFKQVQSIIAQQYRNLNQVHEGSKAVITGLKQSTTLTKEAIAEAVKKEEAAKEAKLLQVHTAYIKQLRAVLTDEQVEKVKDGMTYRVLPITYAAYQDMIPQLTDAQKQQIYTWLTEARDHAMDAESSDKKHWWFGKYKGRINNYLSAEGYDLKKANEDWAKRRNATKTVSPD